MLHVTDKFMLTKPPKRIEEMEVLYYTPTTAFASHLKKYMPLVPPVFIIVQDVDGSYCLLGTNEEFNNWEQYTNYVFKDLKPAMELPHTIFRLPHVSWTKV